MQIMFQIYTPIQGPPSSIRHLGSVHLQVLLGIELSQALKHSGSRRRMEELHKVI